MRTRCELCEPTSSGTRTWGSPRCRAANRERRSASNFALIGACSAHWMSGQQPPDPGAWSRIDDPVGRLRAGLADLYRFYRAGAGMLANVYRDVTTLPAAHQKLLRERDNHHCDVLATQFGGTAGQQRRLRAVVGHATSFWTWHSLCAGRGLSDQEAVEAMTGAVLSVTPGPHAEPA